MEELIVTARTDAEANALRINEVRRYEKVVGILKKILHLNTTNRLLSKKLNSEKFHFTLCTRIVPPAVITVLCMNC